MDTLSCDIKWYGELNYTSALRIQKDLHTQRSDNQINDQLLFMEHSPVYTKGRLSKEEDFLKKPYFLQQLGADVLETDRGGEITFHGPGQLIVYPILTVKKFNGPFQYVRQLENCIIQSLKGVGVEASCIPGLTGVWVGDDKIAAIGIKISRGVSFHGCSINLSTDLSWYDYIVPCGIRDKGVTSVEKITNNIISTLEFSKIFAKQFEKIFSVTLSNFKSEKVTH